MLAGPSLALAAPMRFRLLPVALGLGLFASYAAQATNGYFSHGYGAKAQGQAGVGIAWAQDALAAATNPAGTAEVGERLDVGLTAFISRRSADIAGNAFGADASYGGDGKKRFFNPEFGSEKPLSSTLAAGLPFMPTAGSTPNMPPTLMSASVPAAPPA